MQTAEGAAVIVENLRAEISLVEYQLHRLEDIALSVEDPNVERDLRTVAIDIRKSIDAMRRELEPAEGYEFVP